MGRHIIVTCDPCTQEGARADALIIDIAIRAYSADTPGEHAEPPIKGTLEICSEHGQPIEQVADLVRQHGEPLTKEAVGNLGTLIGLSGAAVLTPSAYWSECFEDGCFEHGLPLRLKKGSVPTHASRTHGRPAAELKIKPAMVPAGANGG